MTRLHVGHNLLMCFSAFACVTWLVWGLVFRVYWWCVSVMCLTCPTHSWERHDSLLCVTRHLYICDITRWCGPVMCVSSPIHCWDTMWLHSYAYVWLGICICATWLVDTGDASWSCVWHALFIVQTWLTPMFDSTPVYVWHDSSICVTWLVHDWFKTHPYVSRDSFICVSRLIHTCARR